MERIIWLETERRAATRAHPGAVDREGISGYGSDRPIKAVRSLFVLLWIGSCRRSSGSPRLSMHRDDGAAWRGRYCGAVRA